jgi:hypothetical protein
MKHGCRTLTRGIPVLLVIALSLHGQAIARQIEVLEQIQQTLEDEPMPHATVFSLGGPYAEDVHLTGNVHLVTDIRRVHGVVEIAVFITLVVLGRSIHTTGPMVS